MRIMKKIRITKIAFKSLLKNKFRTFLMMIGVIIGVAALTIIVSAALGAQGRIMKLVEKFGLKNIAVFSGPGREIGYPFAGETTTTLTLEDAEALRNEIKNINFIACISRKQDVEVKFKERSTTVLLIGTTPNVF